MYDSLVTIRTNRKIVETLNFCAEKCDMTRADTIRRALKIMKQVLSFKEGLPETAEIYLSGKRSNSKKQLLKIENEI